MENVLAMLADEAMLLHVKDVARILTVSTSCAYALIRSGQIKCIRIGLCANEDLVSSEEVAEGANHPALGEFVWNEYYYITSFSFLQVLF